MNMALTNDTPAHKISPSSRDVKRKACDACKRRKVRCTGVEPCPNCVRHGVRCQYTLTHGRLAHSQRRVADLQERISRLELAWKRFVPDIELEHALAASASEDLPTNLVNTSDWIDHSPADIPEAMLRHNYGHDHPNHTSQLSVESQIEAEQGDNDALSWDETEELAEAADGIGSLSMSSKGIGYMGPQSGNALLQNLQSASMLYFSPYDDLTPDHDQIAELPENVLTSASFAGQCIDWYFRHYHTAYPLLHEGFFRAQRMGALPKPKDGSWPILLNTVLALGAHSGNLREHDADIFFYREASRHLSWAILQRGTLSLVQAISLLANYLQKRNRPNSGFTLLGVAMNMAQGIGLHRELSGPSISPFTMELRRRIWWTLFIFDSGARLTFGRPTLTLGGITTQVPRNIADEDLAVDVEEIPPQRFEPTVTSSLVWQIKLARISNLVNEVLLEKQLPEISTAVELVERLDAWAMSLPEYMRADFQSSQPDVFAAPRMILLWRSMHLRVVICRPFILDIIKNRKPLDFTSNSYHPSVHCFSAAEECVNSIVAFWNGLSHTDRPGSLTWYSCYWLVTAVFVHITCLLYDPQNAFAMTWRQHIENSKSAFESMGAIEPTAKRAARILDKIMGLVPSSPDSTFFAGNEPLRMEMAEFWNQSWADMLVTQQSAPSQRAI